MNIYEELGIKTFINALGPVTRYGGSRFPSLATELMASASQHSMNLSEMQKAVSKAIAEMTSNEACYVSCGAVSGIALAIAACMGTSPEAVDQLPKTTGLKGKVLMPNPGTEAVVGVRLSGAELVPLVFDEILSAEVLAQHLNSEVAAVLLLACDQVGCMPLKDFIQTCHDHKVPVLVDGAGQVPPIKNFMLYTNEMGADGFIESGGKGIGGPQSTGLVLGKQWLIDGCAAHGNPNWGIGRGMKVGKEELAAMYGAMKALLARDEQTIKAFHQQATESLKAQIEDYHFIEKIGYGDGTIWVDVDYMALGTSKAQFDELLMSGPDAVKVRPFDHCIGIDLTMLDENLFGKVQTKITQVLKVLTHQDGDVL